MFSVFSHPTPLQGAAVAQVTEAEPPAGTFAESSHGGGRVELPQTLSVSPLSIGISGPAGTPQPEVIESRRTKYIGAEGKDMLVRVWVVQVVQEADYHIEIEGEVYGPYQPSLAFGHPMWNDFLGTLLVLGALTSWLFFAVFAMFGFFVLVVMLRALWARRRPPAGSPPPTP